jgi:hypothetical protein
MSRNPNRCPTRPGELLREDVLPEVKKSRAEISRLLGISRQHLHDILAERKPVSQRLQFALASCLAMVLVSRSGCRVPMTNGRRLELSMYQRYLL